MSDPSNLALPGARPVHNPRSTDRADAPFPDDIGPLSEFREILDLLPVMVYVKDSEGRFIFANREAHEAYGAAPGTLTRRHQSDTHIAGNSLRRYAVADRRVIETGDRHDSPATPFTRADGEKRIVDFTKVRWKKEGDAPGQVLVVGVDVTERDRSEKSLRQQERFAAIGQMTTSMSHELRNPLAAMRTSVEVLRQLVVDDDRRVRSAIERIDRNISRCIRLVEGPLNFTRMRELQRERVDLNGWLSALLAEQPRPSNLRLVESYFSNAPQVFIDPERLRQAVVNVWENACHAVTDSAASSPGSVVARDGALITVSTNIQNQRIEIVVVDNGDGIAGDDLPRVFEPLFSTKGFGTGLGLPIVRQALEQHGGGAIVRSQPASGTMVVLWLPLAPEN